MLTPALAPRMASRSHILHNEGGNERKQGIHSDYTVKMAEARMQPRP